MTSSSLHLSQSVARQTAIVAAELHIAILSDTRGQTPFEFLSRHLAGDWGIVDDDDKQANNDALIHGERVLSAYLTNKSVKIWIITEADRSSTVLLLPDEY